MGPEEGNNQPSQTWSQLRGSAERFSRSVQDHRRQTKLTAKRNTFVLHRRSQRGIVTVRFIRRGDRIRIIGASYSRNGKQLYEKTNR